MRGIQYLLVGIFISVLCFNEQLIAQDTRTQYAPILTNSYIGVNIGSINYAFSSAKLEPGFNVESIDIPRTAVRIILFGHQFNKYLSAQVSYMRPVNWVQYKSINGDQTNHSVWMNVAGLTVASQLPLHKKVSLFTEAGLGLITRKGFSINNVQAVKHANYGTLLTGASLQYHINKKWDLQASTVWSPANKKVKQPHTLFFSGGFNYYMRILSKEKVERNTNSKYIFPKQMMLVGYTTNSLGYGVNNFASKGSIPFFWGGTVHISKGFTLSYQRNIFHTRKVFALDWGAGISYWKSRDNKNKFWTVSVFPVLHFNVVRTKPLDFYIEYAVAGPTLISKTILDGENTGKQFTFHDFMGIGFFAGKQRSFNFGTRIAHYSNGNLFPDNEGLMIPLTFNLGYSF
ncbi:MAG: acyloxyacyl hydrolase [Chitinophagaceae bacterium]